MDDQKNDDLATGDSGASAGEAKAKPDENVADDRVYARAWLNVAFWILAVILTLASVVYQLVTGPTHPINGKAIIAGETIKYKLLRTWEGTTDAEIKLTCPDKISGSIQWKRFGTTDDYRIDRMEYDGKQLIARLPHQPPAGKLEYYVVLRGESSEVKLPPNDRPAIIRFHGLVPRWVLIPHILLMFTAMLFAIRVLIDTIKPMGLFVRYSWLTFYTLTVGGMCFGMFMQRYAFGQFWTGIPFGFDLTDNKTLIAWVAWIVALYFMTFAKNTSESRKRLAAFIASLIMMIIFLIPHSLCGSQLDYSKLEQGVAPSEAVATGM